MLTPQQFEKVADTLVPIWDTLKEWITLEIIDRIVARLGRDEDISLSASDVWQMQVYEDAGGFIEELQKKIVETTKASEQEVRRIFLDYGEKAVKSDNEVLKNAEKITENTIPEGPGNLPSVSGTAKSNDDLLAEPQNVPQSKPQDEEKAKDKPLDKISDRMKDIMQDAYERTNGELRNFTRTTANSTQQVFIKELDNAYLKVVSGGQSQWAAAQEAVDNIIKHQGCVTYPSGHIDTIEVAVIRAIRTGVARMSAALAVENAKENSWNHVLVSSHLGARTGDGTENHGNHAWWQGRVYTIDGESNIEVDGKTVFAPNLELTTGYPSDPTGLCGYNCRHNLTPFTSGMQNPFKEYDSEENKKAYELSQKQRAYERAIRKAKTEVTALSEAVEKCRNEKLQESLNGRLGAAKIKRDNLTREYKDFCKDNNLRTSYERMYVASGSRVTENKTNNVVANTVESGISSKNNSANSDNKVDLEYISSKEYHNKFKGITGDYKVDEQIFKQSQAMLVHRNKTDKEDMCLIDSRTGSIVGRQTHSKSDFCVDYNESLNEAIKNNPRNTLISIHNHPTNNPPTGSDIVTNGSKGYKLGVVVTHNGKVFTYKAGDTPFRASTFGNVVDKYRKQEYNLSEYEAIIRTLNDFKQRYGIEWSER